MLYNKFCLQNLNGFALIHSLAKNFFALPKSIPLSLMIEESVITPLSLMIEESVITPLSLMIVLIPKTSQ